LGASLDRRRQADRGSIAKIIKAVQDRSAMTYKKAAEEVSAVLRQ
jgi:hypothetical protein